MVGVVLVAATAAVVIVVTVAAVMVAATVAAVMVVAATAAVGRRNNSRFGANSDRRRTVGAIGGKKAGSQRR